MKKIIIVALLLVTSISYSFANGTETINETTITSFKNDFADATDIKWEDGKKFTKATFLLNGEIKFAYYSKSGELVAVTRNIKTNQLPLTQLMSLKKNYSRYWISDLFEINTNNETNYYITLENGGTKLILKSAGVYGWEVYNKAIKL